VSLLLDTSTNRTYANAVTVNGTSYTAIFNGGTSNISISSSAVAIVQQFIIVFTGSATPWKVFSNLSQMY
jgi:hypothetical protein